MLKRLIFLAVVTAASVLIPSTAQAHVLLLDESKQIGTVLHIYPDDDPIAGRSSNLLFDVQLPDTVQDQIPATLRIAGEAAEIRTLRFALSGTSGGVDYTFPSQGAYRLRLTVEAPGKTYTFNHVQRVTRGATGGALDSPRYAWADAALVASGTAFLLLVIIMVNNRQAIARQSRM